MRMGRQSSICALTQQTSTRLREGTVASCSPSRRTQSRLNPSPTSRITMTLRSRQRVSPGASTRGPKSITAAGVPRTLQRAATWSPGDRAWRTWTTRACETHHRSVTSWWKAMRVIEQEVDPSSLRPPGRVSPSWALGPCCWTRYYWVALQLSY